jgi:hypothetical protein
MSKPKFEWRRSRRPGSKGWALRTLRISSRSWRSNSSTAQSSPSEFKSKHAEGNWKGGRAALDGQPRAAVPTWFVTRLKAEVFWPHIVRDRSAAEVMARQDVDKQRILEVLNLEDHVLFAPSRLRDREASCCISELSLKIALVRDTIGRSLPRRAF